MSTLDLHVHHSAMLEDHPTVGVSTIGGAFCRTGRPDDPSTAAGRVAQPLSLRQLPEWQTGNAYSLLGHGNVTSGLSDDDRWLDDGLQIQMICPWVAGQFECNVWIAVLPASLILTVIEHSMRVVRGKSIRQCSLIY